MQNQFKSSWRGTLLLLPKNIPEALKLNFWSYNLFFGIYNQETSYEGVYWYPWLEQLLIGHKIWNWLFLHLFCYLFHFSIWATLIHHILSTEQYKTFDTVHGSENDCHLLFYCLHQIGLTQFATISHTFLRWATNFM